MSTNPAGTMEDHTIVNPYPVELSSVKLRVIHNQVEDTLMMLGQENNPSVVELIPVESCLLDHSPVEPNEVSPSQVELQQVKPHQVELQHVEPWQVAPRRLEPQ